MGFGGKSVDGIRGGCVWRFESSEGTALVGSGFDLRYPFSARRPLRPGSTCCGAFALFSAFLSQLSPYLRVSMRLCIPGLKSVTSMLMWRLFINLFSGLFKAIWRALGKVVRRFFDGRCVFNPSP